MRDAFKKDSRTARRSEWTIIAVRLTYGMNKSGIKLADLCRFFLFGIVSEHIFAFHAALGGEG